ncbi:MAG: LysR family transcriptional regulator [Polyangiaceae bacterium]
MDRLAATQAFVRIVELGSFTACARDLGVRQATVSRWLAALEDELGVQLLDRTTRRVRVTGAGQRFYDEAHDLAALWASAADRARETHQLLAGRLRVSVPVVFGQRFVTPHLADFLGRHPKLEIELGFTDRYVDLVSEGVDVALRVGRPVDVGYRARQLAVTPRRLVAAPAFLARHRAPRRPRDLTDLPCLLHRGLDNRAVWSFEKGGRRIRVTVSGRVSVDHSETLLALALAGEGIALLASWLVDDAIGEGRLVPLLADHQLPTAPIQALTAATRHRPRAAEVFLDFLEACLAERLPRVG